MCKASDQKAGHVCNGSFDPKAYWKARLARYCSLQGTGAYLLPLAWQRWLYKGQERAYARLLRRVGVGVSGCHVVDFGCGVGHFEGFWERLGARRADGIDIVPEVIEQLQRDHPSRSYVCADISQDSSGLAVLGAPDMVTAINVLFHIVDDTILLATFGKLLPLVRPQGYFLFTDALAEQDTTEHVRFRSMAAWQGVLGRLGFAVVGKEPVFVVNNRQVRGLRFVPGLAGALQHSLDTFLLRLLPRKANNWAVLAQRCQ